MALEQMQMVDRKVCIGVIAGPHGVDGRVRVKSFTAEPDGVIAYGPVSDSTGARRFTLTPAGTARGMVLARIEGVSDRNGAEALRGIELYIDRERLPAPAEDEYYHADLIGLAVQLSDGTPFGTVRALHNYGAGDTLEVLLDGGGVELLPFTRAVVTVIDLEKRFAVVEPPHEIFVRPDGDGAEEAET